MKPVPSASEGLPRASASERAASVSERSEFPESLLLRLRRKSKETGKHEPDHEGSIRVPTITGLRLPGLNYSGQRQMAVSRPAPPPRRALHERSCRAHPSPDRKSVV